jgi:DNA-binding SARP family transcriptional activator
VDLDEFDKALANARAATDALAAARWYRQAISFWQGEFLQHLDYDWVFPVRRRVNRDTIAALCNLADFELAADRREQALELIQQALQLDPLNEEGHCRAMKIYAEMGDQSGLMR